MHGGKFYIMYFSKIQATGPGRAYRRAPIPRRARAAVWVKGDYEKEYAIFEVRTKEKYALPFVQVPRGFPGESILWLKAIEPLRAGAERLGAWIVRLDGEEWLAVPMGGEARRAKGGLVWAPEEEIKKLCEALGEFVFVDMTLRKRGEKETVKVHGFAVHDDAKPERLECPFCKREGEFWFPYANAVLECPGCGALVALSPGEEVAEAACEITGEERPRFEAVDVGNGWSAVFVKRGA